MPHTIPAEQGQKINALYKKWTEVRQEMMVKLSECAAGETAPCGAMA